MTIRQGILNPARNMLFTPVFQITGKNLQDSQPFHIGSLCPNIRPFKAFQGATNPAFVFSVVGARKGLLKRGRLSSAGGWLALLGLVIVFSLDRLTHFLLGDITLAPLLSIVWLAFLASFLSPRKVLLSTPWYAILSFFLLTHWRYSFTSDSLLGLGSVEPSFSYSRGIVRSLTVLFAGGLCALLSHQRERLQIAVDEVVTVLTGLPLGVVISNPSGLISFANDHAARILGISTDELVGSSYFSLLNSPSGNTIEKYSLLAEIAGTKSERMTFYLRKNPRAHLTARLFCLQAASGRLIATIFDDLPAERSS